MWKVAVLLCVFVVVARSQFNTTAVNQCVYNDGSLPINTYIEGCFSPPCLLPQLQDVVLNIIFRAPHTIRSMRTLAKAYVVGSYGIDHALGEQEVTCNYLGNTYCPLLAGEVVQYTLKMYIESYFFVGTAVTVEFWIVDEKNEGVICLRVPIRIIAAINPAIEGKSST